MSQAGSRGASVAFDSTVFSLDSVKKAAYRLSDRFTVDIRPSGQELVCLLEFKAAATEEQQQAYIAEFRAEVLDQDLRRTIAEETEPMRNAILALAFSPVTAKRDEQV